MQVLCSTAGQSLANRLAAIRTCWQRPKDGSWEEDGVAQIDCEPWAGVGSLVACDPTRPVSLARYQDPAGGGAEEEGHVEEHEEEEEEWEEEEHDSLDEDEEDDEEEHSETAVA